MKSAATQLDFQTQSTTFTLWHSWTTALYMYTFVIRVTR